MIIITIINRSNKEIMHSQWSVCMSVCMSVCVQNISKTSQHLMTLSGLC